MIYNRQMIICKCRGEVRNFTTALIFFAVFLSLLMVLGLAACGDSRAQTGQSSAEENLSEGAAEHIADGLNADLYEILPEEPYTDTDFDYNDNNSRSTIEMNDPDARPAISGSIANMDQYEIVFIG